jgi:hypothetical protein
MDTKKVAILVLVLIAVVAFMALGAGAYRDHQEKGRSPDLSADAGVKLIDKVTGVFRSKFDVKRLQPGTGCSVSGGAITVSGPCQVLVAPGSARPSRFRLSPAGGTVFLCFAMSRGDFTKCVAGGGDPKPKELEKPADFTVAKDTTYLYLDCRSSGGNCGLTVR